jgi:tetratricopeptide (TPR) repeat protein
MRRIVGLLLIAALAQTAAAQDFNARGKASLAAGDTTRAIESFQGAVKAKQNLEEAYYYLGAIALGQGRVKEAVKMLETSVDLEEDNVEVLKALGNAYIANGEAPKALDVFGRAEKLAPKDGDLLTAYGIGQLEAGHTDEAIRLLVLAKEYRPADPRIYIGLGDAYLNQNVPVLATSNYQKAIELNPNDIETRFQLASVFEKNRQYTEAVREYDGVIGVDSTYADAYLAKGNILVLAKLYQRAVPALRSYVALKPENARGSQLLAKALFGAEDWAAAGAAAETSLRIDSSDAEVWRIYAYSLVETREYEKALEGFAGLQRRNAMEPEDQAKYGNALYGMGRQDEALAALLEAVRVDSTNCEPFFNLGSIYMRMGRYDSAAAMFERRLECDPRSLSSYLNAAASYIQVKNYARSKELLVRALELKPDWLLGKLWLARYYSLVDTLDQARVLYEDVLTQIGTDTEKYKKEACEAHYLLGSYYFQKQQWNRSLEECVSASRIGCETAELRLMWGQALLQTLDPQKPEENKRITEQAVGHFRRSIQINPSNPISHLWLGQSLILMRVEGDDAKNRELQAEACQEFRQVLKLDPRNEDAKKAMARYSCPGAG